MAARNNGNKKIVELSPFRPEPWQRAPLLDKSPVLLMWGPSGAGRSTAAAEKVAAFALHYPGSTCVCSRKKFEDMLKSTIPLVKDTALDDKHNPRTNFRARENRIIVDHGTGKPISEIIFTGIFDDNSREGLKSIGKKGSVDMWWLEEATEFEEEDFNIVTTRMRGTTADWTQVILTCNPGPKLHWINRRLIIGGEASAYYADATMNSHNAKDYLQKLQRLTGVDKVRLYEGRWADGSGIVIDPWLDNYNPKTGMAPGNVTPDAEYIPGGGEVIWFMDDGYAGDRDEKTGWFTDRSNPRVFLLVQKRANDRLVIFDEEYDVQVLASKHIARVKQMCQRKGYPLPEYVIHDGASPSLGGELIRAGLRPKPIRTKIDEGNKELRSWVGPDENDVRRLLVHPRCKYYRFEMASYAYDKDGEPIDAHNHGVDASRYGVWYEAYGGLQPASVAAHGIDLNAIDARIAEVLARLEEKYANALS